MSPRKHFRAAMYSHDTFGLGHFTRTLRLARAITEAVPGAGVLILTGSPFACRTRLPAGIECVKLPSVTKLGAGAYAALQLPLSFRRVREMRARIVRESVRLFRPHILFVDNVPLGMKGEMVPALEDVRRRRPCTRIHLNLRDVLDDPAVIRADWGANGTYEALDALYDEVHVFGDPAVHDAVAAYGLPADRTRHLGYLAPPGPPRRGGQVRDASAHRSVLVTIGGGGDGSENLEHIVALQRGIGAASPFRFELVLGPFHDPAVRARLERDAAAASGVRLHEYVERLPEWMPEHDVVISMGGYNTMCEVMSRARRSIAIPRLRPRREQAIRVEALAMRGLVRAVGEHERTPEGLEAALRSSLERGPVLPGDCMPPLDGLARFQLRIREIACELGTSVTTPTAEPELVPVARTGGPRS